MEIAVIGAGPIGLYLAIRLKQLGLSVRVFDARANEYSRPGHLNSEVFEKVGQGLGKQFWRLGQFGHIKDLERGLYQLAIEYQIPIIKHNFSHFEKNQKTKGFYIKKEEEYEFVACDYLFDCTGGKRKVLYAVNEMDKTTPFMTKEISPAAKLTKHFLAYVRMDNEDIERLNVYEVKGLQNVTSLEWMKNIFRLNELGWEEFCLPRCYGIEFKNNKVCLYLEAPNSLQPLNYMKWVKTVLECVTSSQHIDFQQLVSSKPNKKKPHFECFSIDPVKINLLVYKGDHLPIIIPQGDAQIDANYYLAHGIVDGIDRVDILLNSLTIVEGKISRFEEQQYQELTQQALFEHEKELTDHYKERLDSFCVGMSEAESYYKELNKNTEIQSNEYSNFSSFENRLNKHKDCLSKLTLFSPKIHTIQEQGEQLSTSEFFK